MKLARTVCDIPLSERETVAVIVCTVALVALILASPWIGRAVMTIGGWL